MFAGGLTACAEALAASTDARLGAVDVLGGALAPSAIERAATMGLGELGARAESVDAPFVLASGTLYQVFTPPCVLHAPLFD
jgi:hypothetical protein